MYMLMLMLILLLLLLLLLLMMMMIMSMSMLQRLSDKESNYSNSSSTLKIFAKNLAAKLMQVGSTIT